MKTTSTSAVILIATLASLSLAQPTPQICDPGPTGTNGIYGVQGLGQPTPCAVQPFPTEYYRSICWRSPLYGNFLPPDGLTGFDLLNLDLWWGPTPGDYPPRSVDLSQSSSPLIPAVASTGTGPTSRSSRPMLSDAVDLITGMPLLQDIDFELPFGSAVFRHVRTYSELPAIGLNSNLGADSQITPADWYWDWQGIGWMMSENPIFLLDARYWGWRGNDESLLPRERCYFVPDAHHSIPFDLDTTSGAYVAPPHIDALLTHNGIGWNPTDQTWSTKPDTFKVWLHNHSVVYTIQAFREDVYKETTRDAHNPPVVTGGTWSEGWGIPYYGLVTSIDDRHGNRIQIHYSAFVQHDCDHPDTPCNECCQNCQDKGQIKYIELVARADTTSPEYCWTLLYTHRAFQADPSELGFSRHGNKQQALHSIHVYRNQNGQPMSVGTASGQIPPHNLTLRDSIFHYADNLLVTGGNPPDQATVPQVIDALSYLDGVHQAMEMPGLPGPGAGQTGRQPEWQGLPAGSEYIARYLYSDGRQLFAITPRAHQVFWAGGLPPIGDWIAFPLPLLLKATVRHVGDDTPQAPVQETHRVYRYAQSGLMPMPTPWSYSTMYLRLVIDPDAANSLQAQMVESLIIGGLTESMASTYWPLGLLYTPDTDEIDIPAPDGTAEPTRRVPFASRASMRLVHWLQEPQQLFGDFGSFPQSPFHDELVNEHVELNPNNLVSVHDGVLALNDRRSSSNEGRWYKVYRFLSRPPGRYQPWTQPAGYVSMVFGDNDNNPNAGTFPPDRAIFHDPYRYMFINDVASSQTPDSAVETPATDAMWITVIDEYKDEPTCQFKKDLGNGDFSYGNYATAGKVSDTGAVTRRVVYMNLRGQVLKDKTWSIADDQVLADEGLLEQFRYDDRGRMTERLSAGWGSPQNIAPQSNGLITVYTYNDESPKFPDEVGAIGIKRGETGTVQWLHQYCRTDPKRPELVTHDITFLTPPALLPSFTSPPSVTDSNNDISVTQITFVIEGDDPKTNKVRSKQTTRPAAPKRPGPGLGDPLYPDIPLYAVASEWYDEYGRAVWSGQGTVQNPFSTARSDPDEFHATYTEYDTWGRVLHSIMDAVPGVVPSNGYPFPLEVPGVPGDFSPRYGPTAPLLYATSYQHDNLGTAHVWYPNKRQDITLYRWQENNRAEQRVYKDLVLEGNLIYAAGPGEVRTLVGERVQGGAMVRWYDPEYADSLGDLGDEEPQDIARVDPEYDSGGNPTKVTVSAGGASVTAAVQYDTFGQVARQRDPDGTITRTVSNIRGQPERVFRGTLDRHVFWGTAAPGEDNDNLVLTEKRYYGTGVHNALKLTTLRRYRDKPSDQYGPATNEDDIGWREEHGYDWRMRDVLVSRFAADNGSPTTTVITNTITFLDHSDRIRFVADYGADVPTDPLLNPSLDTSDSMVPTAVQILTGSPRPLRLSETIYNKRGQVQEQRRYNVDDATGASYLTTLTFYDHRDQPAFTTSPGGGRQFFTYDALGRRVKSSTFAAGLEISRTETDYDASGDAVVTRQYDRTHDGQGAALDSTNSVVTYSLSWYDIKHRILATADLGTAQTDGTFTYGPQPTRPGGDTDPIPPPTLADAKLLWTYLRDPARLGPSARVTTYQYDAEGHKSRSVNPAGSLTTYVYDGLGQMLTMIENAEPAPGEDNRETYYKYENGKLVGIMAHQGTDLNPELVPAWFEPSTSQTQVTRFLYGAAIVDSNFNSTGALHNSLLSGIDFPDSDPYNYVVPPRDLAFTYFPDGTLATRFDERGIEFRYSYDTLGRLSRTQVIYPPEFLPPGLPSQPVDRITDIRYTYDGLGQLTAVTAWSDDPDAPNSTAVLVSDIALAHDSRGNLTGEWQSHGAPVDPAATPVIGYDWQYSAATTGAPGAGFNFDRLLAMTYPKRIGVCANTGLSRTVGLEYGPDPLAATIDNILSRVTRITDTIGGSTQEAAAYSYAGSSRRVSTRLGWDAATQTFSSGSPGSVGYAYLNAFGQPSDLHYTRAGSGGSPQTLWRAVMGYTDSGDRKYSKVTQASIDGEHHNDRSALYGYDSLQRLIANAAGTLNQDSSQPPNYSITDPDPGQAILARYVDYRMDSLGNLAGGGGNAPGRRIRGQLDADPDQDTHETTHAVGPQNQIASITELPPTGGPTTTQFFYDKAGNLTCDGTYYYQYDGWNRLIQVNQRGTLIFNTLTGQPTEGAAGPWILHYTYDALGRLMRKQVPYGAPLANGDSQVRTEHYYYDGVRRVAETVTDPLTIVNEDPPGGEEEGGSPIGVGEEAGIVGDPPPSGGGTPTNPPVLANTWTDREYLYSPGYVDEFVAQIDRDGKRWYVIQDASYDTAALIEEEIPSAPNDPGASRVAVQYTWDPYGELLTKDHAAGIDETSPAATSRLGHHGLFFDRLDGVIGDTATPQMQPRVVGIYHIRNRIYHPTWQRWGQKDPHGTGLVLLSLSLSATRTQPSAISPSATAIYGDGMSAHAYLANEPNSRIDPTGLFFGLAAQAAVMGVDAWDDASSKLEEAATGLRTIFGLGEMLADYAEGQSYGAEVAASNDIDDRHMVYAASGIAFWVLLGEESHHVIPRFLLGLDRMANRLGLPPNYHDDYHEILRQEFRNRWLNPPNAQGGDNWRRRLLAGRVRAAELNEVKSALMQSGRRFDSTFPQYVQSRGSVAARIRLELSAPNLPAELRTGRRARR